MHQKQYVFVIFAIWDAGDGIEESFAVAVYNNMAFAKDIATRLNNGETIKSKRGPLIPDPTVEYVVWTFPRE